MMRLALALLVLAAAGPAQAQGNRGLLDVLDRLTREANFRNSEVNDGRPETSLQMPLRATQYPGVCSQDNLRIRSAASIDVTLKDIETRTTYRVVADPRPSPETARPGYNAHLDAECDKFEIAHARAPNAWTAWAGAYAVALVREELKKPESALLKLTCARISTSCEAHEVLLTVIKPEEVEAARMTECADGQGRCVQVGGFYDANGAKERNRPVFLSVIARFDRDPSGGVGAFRGAELTEEVVRTSGQPAAGS